jgi:hypothetical protein
VSSSGEAVPVAVPSRPRLSPVARAVCALVADGVDPDEALWFADAMAFDGKDPVALADKLLGLRASARAKGNGGSGWGQRQPGTDRPREAGWADGTLYRP